MGILVNTGFDVGSSSPVDNRTVKNTTDERNALATDGLVYENLKVYCKDTQKEYRWTGTEWEEVGTGGTVDLSGYAKTYTSLSELGLTADATFQDVIDTLPKGGSALLGVEDFTNYQTIFPYEEGSDQYARVHIVKGVANGSSVYARWFKKNGAKEAIAAFNTNDNKFSGWKKTGTDNGVITEDTITKYGTEILKYPVGTWRIGSLNIGKQFTDLPLTEIAGIIEIDSIYTTKSPHEHTYAYRNYTIRDALSSNIYIRTLNSGNTAGVINKDTGWQQIQAAGTKKTAAFNSKTFKIDITKGNENWNGNMKFGYCVDESYGEIIISSLGKTEVLWDHSTGVRYVKSVTYTIDPDNKAHVTIGVELYETVYGIHQLETCGDFATINSFTGDAFTGTSVAKRGATRGRNNGVGILCEVEDLGLTKPCTTIQIAQAMISLTKSANRIPTSGMIGIFENYDKSITDAPTSYGLLQVNVYGNDRIMIRYDGVSNSSHTGSWIGQIKGSSGTFNSITWSRLDNETRITTLETRVNELFQSVSNGKSLVANAITGKGVITATNATFATMATNISKIQNVNSVNTYKEETKSSSTSMTSMTSMSFTFSAKVLGVKKIIAPKDGLGSSTPCNVVAAMSDEAISISGRAVTLYVNGPGTWKVTAIIEA